jgi:hypothetical protein
LAELPSEQLQVLELAFYQEQSQSEIATQLALPLGTVKSRMRLGFAKLRAALGHGGTHCRRLASGLVSPLPGQVRTCRHARGRLA